MSIVDGEKGVIYKIKNINANNEIKEFLFTLGCFEGEKISITKKLSSNLILNIKGGRYAIDKNLAYLIEIE